MIDTITNRQSAPCAAKTDPAAAAKTAAARSVPGSFQSALASTASKVNEPLDTLQISGMSDWQKLAELKRLHEQTDYSGMTEIEKYKLINDRFEARFPLMAMKSSLYGPICVCGDELVNKHSIRDQVVTECERQCSEAGMYNPCRKVSLRRQAYYDGMTDAEIIAAVNKKYTGSTMIDRAGMLYELSIMELDGNGGRTFRSAIDAMRNRLVRQVTGDKDNWWAMSANNPWQEMQIIQIASNTTISWGAVNQLTKEYAYHHDTAPKDSLDWLLEELGKHSESLAEKGAVQRQIQEKQMQEVKVQEKQAQEKQAQEKQAQEKQAQEKQAQEKQAQEKLIN